MQNEMQKSFISQIKKQIFKYRIKLFFSKVKTWTLYEFEALWLFSPFLASIYISKIKFQLLGWFLGWQFFIMFYFNLKLSSEENFLLHKWLQKLEDEQNELCGIIYEMNCLKEETESQLKGK